MLESHDFTKQNKTKNLEYKIYSLYCWSHLLFSHFSLKSAFVSQRPWYLPLYLPFYHSYWTHGNYCEIVKLQASFMITWQWQSGVLCLHKVLISFSASRGRWVHLTLKITWLVGAVSSPETEDIFHHIYIWFQMTEKISLSLAYQKSAAYKEKFSYKSNFKSSSSFLWLWCLHIKSIEVIRRWNISVSFCSALFYQNLFFNHHYYSHCM